MVFADLFNLSDEEYAIRIKTYTNEKLWQQLKVKNMQIKVSKGIMGSAGAVTGFLFGSDAYIPVVAGSVSSIGLRRVTVSNRKIQLMESELRGRGHSTKEVADDTPPAYEQIVIKETNSGRIEVAASSSSRRIITLVLFITIMVGCLAYAWQRYLRVDSTDFASTTSNGSFGTLTWVASVPLEVMKSVECAKLLLIPDLD